MIWNHFRTVSKGKSDEKEYHFLLVISIQSLKHLEFTGEFILLVFERVQLQNNELFIVTHKK